MWFGKKEVKKPEKELPDIREAKFPAEDVDIIMDEINSFSKDVQSIIRPISFKLENDAPNMIKAMNTNNLAADPFMLTVSNAKLVLNTFYDIIKKETESSDPQCYYISPNSIFVAHDVFTKFMISEFYNVVATDLCTRVLSRVSKAFALYILDQLNNKKDIDELSLELRNIVSTHAYRYRSTIEKNENLTLAYYTEFNNAMFMALYAPMIDRISRIIDLDSRALKYMLDDDAVREIYHILDDESLAYLKANIDQNIIIIKNCYKAIIEKDLNDIFMVFPDIVSKTSSILEKHCYNMEMKIKKLEATTHNDRDAFLNCNPFGVDPIHLKREMHKNQKDNDDD